MGILKLFPRGCLHVLVVLDLLAGGKSVRGGGDVVVLDLLAGGKSARLLG